MSAPTEYGRYWWRQTVGGEAVVRAGSGVPGPWETIEAIPECDMVLIPGRDVAKYTFADLCEKGEWGPRIPEPPAERSIDCNRCGADITRGGVFTPSWEHLCMACAAEYIAAKTTD